MATKEARARRKEAGRRRAPVEVPEVAQQRTAEVMQRGKGTVERVEGETQQIVGRAILREAPYAGIGLGHVVAETVRNLDTGSLPERLRRAPGAVASKVGGMGSNAKVSYLALAARGRAVRLSSAGRGLTGEVQNQTEAGVELTKDTAAATRDVATEAVDQAVDTAAQTGGRVRGAIGRVTGAARRSTRTGEHDETADPMAQSPDGATDTGAGPLEKRTVAQLRERARELGIESRAGMRKKELIQAIRDAT